MGESSPESAAPPAPTDEPLAGMHKKWLWGLLGVAALIKIVYFFEYLSLPFIRGPLFDSVIYLWQADAIRNGNFGDPTLFSFSPLYGYVLAAVGGGEVLIQFVLGLFNVWLLCRITARQFGATAGLIAGALYVGYGLFLFYESKVMSETIGLTLLLASVALYLSPDFRRGRWLVTIGCGAFLGLAVHARSNVMYAALFYPAIAILPWSKDAAEKLFKRRLLRAVGVTIGVGLLLTANGMWNKIHAGKFVPIRVAQLSTATAWDGTIERFKKEDPNFVDVWHFVQRAKEQINKPPDPNAIAGVNLSSWKPMDILRAAPSKLSRVVSNTETTFQYGYYGERTEVLSLQLMPVGFTALLILGVVGAGFIWRRNNWRDVLPHLPLILGATATAVLSFPASRYRIPMVVPLIMLTAMAVVSIAGISNKQRRTIAAAAAGLVFVFFSYQTMAYELKIPGMWHLRVAESEAKGGNARGAIARVQHAFDLEPDNPVVRQRGEYILSLLRQVPVQKGTAIPAQPVGKPTDAAVSD